MPCGLWAVQIAMMELPVQGVASHLRRPTSHQSAIVSTAFVVPMNNVRAMQVGPQHPTALNVQPMPSDFLDGNGNCAVCGLGCQQCADGSGICVTSKQGFTQDANDRTKCDAVQAVTSSGTVCPDGSFSSGSACQPCSPSCSTCSGPTSNNCIVCGNGQFLLGGSCVPTNGNGVCTGSSMIANNNKHSCDSKSFFPILIIQGQI